MSWRRQKKFLLALLILGMLGSFGLWVKTEAKSPQFSSKIEINSPLQFGSADEKVYNLNYEEVNVRRLLRNLAHQAGVNILFDESVDGEISISLNDVSFKEAFDYIRNLSGLFYLTKGDNIILVTTKSAAAEKGLAKTISKIIPVRFVNARLISSLLNATVFLDPAQAASTDDAAGTGGKKATPEYRTNSVIIVGDRNDIRLAQEVIDKIDIPRESRVFRINHAGPVEIAQLLQATVFNDGITPFDATGESDSTIPSSATGVSVDVETFEEGSGAASEVQGSSGGEGGGGEQQTFTLRKKSIATKDIKIAPDGPILVPDTRTGTLTVMGTIEQIALAESLIPTLDQKLPQVAIETSLVEIYETGLREMKTTMGSSDGQFGFGFNNTNVPSTPAAGSPAVAYRPSSPVERQYIRSDGTVGTRYSVPGLFNNVLGLPTAKDKAKESMEFAWTTQPIERSSQLLVQIDAVIAKRQAKLLANPTVIAVHNTEAIISITEEIVRSTEITRDATGFMQTQVEIGEAGIVLNILPNISGDGYISLRIRPSVSTPANQVEDQQGNTITLLNRRDLAVQQVRLANGQTVALGGLIQERELSQGAKIPIVGDIPLIGALFRTSYKDNIRTELVMLVTPRIMEDSHPVDPQSRISSLMRKAEFREMIEDTGKRKFNK